LLPTFWDNPSGSSSSIKQSKNNSLAAWLLWMESIGFPETWLTIYQTTLHKIPEQRST